MRGFLTLSTTQEASILRDIPAQDDDIQLTRISDLDVPEDGNLSASMESFEELITHAQTAKRFSWGEEPTMGPGPHGEGPPPPPEFIIIKGSSGVLYVYVNFIRHQIGALYQFLTSLNESDKVMLMFYGLNPCHVTAVQTAIVLSKASIHTKCFMIENEYMDAGLFFTWMVGDILEPIPYGVVSIIEPLTLFSGSMNPSSSAKNDNINYDAALKSKWYGYAEAIGLLTIGEITDLNKGKSVLITDINDRVIKANAKKEQMSSPFNHKAITV